MAQSILLKRSSVAGNVPDSSDLSLGEIAINTADGAVYIKKGNNDIVAVHDNDILHIDTTNSRIGIGTTSPTSRLHVNSGTSDWPIKAESTDAKAGIILSDNNTVNYIMSQSYTLSMGNQPSLHANNLNIKSTGSVGIGTTAPVSNLHVHVGGGGGVVLEANANTDIDFRYRSNGSNKYNVAYDASEGSLIWYDNVASTRRMTLSSAGNIGIGTSAPATKLHVANGSDTSDAVRISGGHASRYLAIRTFENNTLVGAGISLNASSSGGAFRFQTTSTDRMTIANDGKVGIGTMSPAYPLEISGEGTVSLAYQRTGTGVTAKKWGFHSDNSNTYWQNITDSILAITVANSGNVGIGTTSPSFKLHVDSGTTDTVGYFKSSDNKATILISDDDTNTYVSAESSTSSIGVNPGRHANNLNIDSSGNVGIGTTSPDTKLDITAAGVDGLIMNQDTGNSSASGRIFFKSTERTNTILNVSGNLEFRTGANIGSSSGTVRMTIVGSTGAVKFNNAYTFPTSDGSANQVLKTDGSGNLTFATVAGASGGTSISDSDGDTKIQVEESSDEDKIRFDTAGSQRMVIDSGGNFGFGVDTPSNYFHVKKNSAGIIARIEGTSGRYIYTGTDTQGQYLEQVGTSSTDRVLRIQNSNGSGQYTQLFLDGHNRRIYTNGGVNVGIGVTSPGGILDVDGTYGDLKIGDPSIGSRITYYDTTRILLNSNDIIFQTNSLTERMRIKNDGKVGIGTASPYYKLDTRFANTNTSLSGGSSGNWGSNGIRIENTDSTAGVMALAHFRTGDSDWHIGNKRVGQDSADFIFAHEGSTKITFDNAGNVGIGTTSPSQKLHVAGNIYAASGFVNSSGYQLNGTYVVDSSRNLVNIAAITTSGNVTIGGNLTVNGTQTILNTSTLTVDDKIITIADGATDAAAANESGINVDGASATVLYKSGNDRWEFNKEAFSALGFMVGTTSTDVGLMRNNSGVFDFQAQSNRQISFSNVTNGEHVRIDAGGKVGIGITAPTEALHVVGNIKTTGDVIADTHFTSTDSNATLSSSGSGGNVYLRPNGKSSSTSQTHINTSGVMVLNTTSTSHGIEVAQSTNTGYAPASILLKATQSTARGGGIYSYNTQSDNGWYSGSLYNNTNLWAVTFLNGTSFNPAIAQTTNAIFTVDGPNNRVGIGTTSPTDKLHVAGNINIVSNKIYNGSANNSAGLELGGSRMNLHGYNGIRFYASAAGIGSQTERMRIENNGNVGIGTTNPQGKLDVDGDLRITRNIVSNTVYQMLSLGSDRSIDDYGGLNKDYWRINLATPGASTDGGSSAHAYGTLIFSGVTGSNTTYVDRMAITPGGNVGIGTNTPSAKFQVEEYGIDSTSTSSSATTQIAIHTFAAATFRSARFTVQVTNSTDSTYHTTELLLVHDGTTANITEFGEIHTGSAVEATFDCDVNSGNVRLLATPASTDTMAFKVVCHSITT